MFLIPYRIYLIIRSKCETTEIAIAAYLVMLIQPWLLLGIIGAFLARTSKLMELEREIETEDTLRKMRM